MSCAIYGKLIILILSACAVSLPPSSLAGELSTDKTDDSGFLSTQRMCTVSYTCRFNKMTSSSLIGALWQRWLAGMTVISMHYNIMVIVLKDSSRLEADLMHVGTAMSVEFATTHQGFCCEPLNLAQHISLTPSPNACSWSFTLFYMQRWKWVKGSYYNIVLSLPACAANAMQRAEGFVL